MRWVYLLVALLPSLLTTCNGRRPALSHDVEWTTVVQLGHGVEAKWITRDDEWITMEVKAPTYGWVALGFSQNGAMKGADMVMGWVDDRTGNVYIKDLHGVGNEVPVEDDSQDVELLGGESQDGSTRIRFRRKWNTCDKDDYVIGEQTIKLIWAFGNQDPSSTRFNPRYHERHGRGVKNVNLRLPPRHTKFPEEFDEPDSSIKHFDIQMDQYPVPGHEVTEYFCKMMKYPNFRSRSQIVGWRPIIQKENIALVHHIVIYECVVPEGNSTAIFEKHLGRVESCFSHNMPPEWVGYCWTQPIVWTIGGDGDMFPTHTGMPLGEKHGGSTYFFMELHYDNPDLIPFTDSSGLRIYYTDKPRQEDLATLFIGKRFSTFHFVAPSVIGYQAFGGCTTECTQKAFPEKGITATHVLLHAHTVTQKIVLRHVRNGVELPPIGMDTNYDINYQQARIIDPPRQILPGDELYTYCHYDTTDRDIPVYGGIETNTTEMCHSFLTYYPKMPLSMCQWQTEYNDFLGAFGIEKLEGELLQSVSTPYKPMLEDKFDPTDEALVLLALNKSMNLFTNLRIGDSGMNHGKNFWNYLAAIKWRADESKLAHALNRKLEKARNYAYCTAAAHYKIPLKKYILDPPKYKAYVDPADHMCLGRAFGLQLVPSIFMTTTLLAAATLAKMNY